MPGKEEIVVVAEDSVPNRTVLALLLKRMGFTVIECGNGEEAWSAIDSNAHNHIVAVFSDLMMPEVDGLELLRRVRNDKRLKDLRFVFVTAVSDNEYIFEAKNLLVNGYILKPVTYQRVSLKLQELFPGRKFPQLAS